MEKIREVQRMSDVIIEAEFYLNECMSLAQLLVFYIDNADSSDLDKYKSDIAGVLHILQDKLTAMEPALKKAFMTPLIP